MGKHAKVEPTWRDIAAAELKIPSESARQDIETERASRVYALAKGMAIHRVTQEKETTRKRKARR